MAERLVLAELDVDSTQLAAHMSQARSSFDQTNVVVGKFGKTAQQTADFSDVLTRRMFSLRSAAVALLGSFTLAGLIFQIGSLIKTLITGTEWWKSFSTAAEDAFLALVKGETAVERTNRKLTALFKEAGVAFKELDAVNKLEKIVKLMEELGKVSGDAAVGQLAFIRALQAQSEAINALIPKGQELIRTQEGFGLGKAAPAPGPLLPFQKRMLEIGRTGLPVTEEELQLPGSTAFVGGFRTPEALGESMFAFVPEAQRGMDLLNLKVQETSTSMEAFGLASQAAGQLIAQALLEGGVSAGELAKALIKSFAATAIVEGMMELARGFAALATTWGVPNPKATAHFHAAGIFFLIGGAAAGVSAALGGRGGGGMAGAGGFPAGTPFGAQQNVSRQVNVTVIIPGVVLGPSSKEQLAGELTDLVREYLKDNPGALTQVAVGA